VIIAALGYYRDQEEAGGGLALLQTLDTIELSEMIILTPTLWYLRDLIAYGSVEILLCGRHWREPGMVRPATRLAPRN
jgi:hypothetical protein